MEPVPPLASKVISCVIGSVVIEFEELDAIEFPTELAARIVKV
jgi:hypothetical protein